MCKTCRENCYLAASSRQWALDHVQCGAWESEGVLFSALQPGATAELGRDQDPAAAASYEDHAIPPMRGKTACQVFSSAELERSQHAQKESPYILASALLRALIQVLLLILAGSITARHMATQCKKGNKEVRSFSAKQWSLYLQFFFPVCAMHAYKLFYLGQNESMRSGVTCSIDRTPKQAPLQRLAPSKLVPGSCMV